MRRIDVQWVGNLSLKQSVFRGVEAIVNEFTSEHDGMVKVVAFLQNQSNLIGKRPFLYRNEIYLAVFEETFILIFEDNSLNIRELIFIYDNEISNHEDLFMDVDICTYFNELGM